MGATTISVNKLIAHIGMRVVRGKDWVYGNQEGEIGTPGTITTLDTKDSMFGCKVKWDGKSSEILYRIEENGAYDLYVYHDEQKQVDETAEGKEYMGWTEEMLKSLKEGDKLRVVATENSIEDGSYNIGTFAKVGNIVTVNHSLSTISPIPGRTSIGVTSGNGSGYCWARCFEPYSTAEAKIEVKSTGTDYTYSWSAKEKRAVKKGDRLLVINEENDKLSPGTNGLKLLLVKRGDYVIADKDGDDGSRTIGCHSSMYLTEYRYVVNYSCLRPMTIDFAPYSNTSVVMGKAYPWREEELLSLRVGDQVRIVNSVSGDYSSYCGNEGDVITIIKLRNDGSGFHFQFMGKTAKQVWWVKDAALAPVTSSIIDQYKTNTDYEQTSRNSRISGISSIEVQRSVGTIKGAERRRTTPIQCGRSKPGLG